MMNRGAQDPVKRDLDADERAKEEKWHIACGRSRLPASYDRQGLTGQKARFERRTVVRNGT